MIIFLKEKMINLKTSIKKKKSIALIQGLAKYRTWVYILPLNFCLNPKLVGKIHVCARLLAIGSGPNWDAGFRKAGREGQRT